jgi:cytochrome P450
VGTSTGAPLSLYRLLDPDVLADPYRLYEQLRTEAPVLWDPYLHAWVVTRYTDVVDVLTRFSAARTPDADRLAALGMEKLGPIADVMVRQMLFLDPPQHTRVRGLAAAAFTPRRVEHLRAHIADIAETLLDRVADGEKFDVIDDFASPLPAIVTAEMLGLPIEDHVKLKTWSETFAEMLGNFQHNPGRAGRVLATLEEMLAYFSDAVRRQSTSASAGDGLVHALATAEIDGDRLSEEEVVANLIVTMVGGQETTTNLIGNGLLALLVHPEQMQRLRDDLSLVPSAVEELLRFESPSQHTARLAPADTEIDGRSIRRGQAVIAVMGAANRDPARFPDPDRLDIERTDNRHVAFGWAAHFCFGAPLARIEGQAAFTALLRRFPDLSREPGPASWRPNLGLRGLSTLPVRLRG